tara:strand:+ start:237 stop:740 length:504 start_codon:yes stop_codon:yes gene_type:complete
MAKYTHMLPKLEYNGVTIADITHRIDMLKEVSKFQAMYYEIRISEDMTPEKVAEDVYGDQDLWWVVCTINKVIDPFYDWVKREHEVYRYTDLAYADRYDIHHYEDQNYVQYPTDSPENDRVPITNLDWEIYKNDKLRSIMLLKPQHIPKIVEEFKSWMRNTKPQVQE